MATQAVRQSTSRPAQFPPRSGDSFDIALPAWAKSTEARLLLSLIQHERPERDRVLTEMFNGQAVDYGFSGRNAAKLRAIFDRTYDELISWASAAPTKDGFQRRRDAVIAYTKDFGADAVIARVLA